MQDQCDYKSRILLEGKLVNAETTLIEHSPYKVFRILQTLYHNIIEVEEGN